MEQYPKRIPVGTPPYQLLYELQGNQLLLKLEHGLNDEKIDGLLRSLGLKERTADALPRGAGTLRAANMRWVVLEKVPNSLSDFAWFLVHDHTEIIWAVPVYYVEGQGAESAASPLPDILVILLKEKQENSNWKQMVEQKGLHYNEQMSNLLDPFYYFRLDEVNQEKNAFELIKEVAKLPGVALVEFDWLKLETYFLVPGDPFWPNQWNMSQINMVNAWDVQIGAAAVWLAIIDSGFDLAHPDLTFTSNVPPNPTHFNAEEAIAGNPPPYNAGPSGVPHGTAVAGIAAAQVNNGLGVAGVAGGCSIMPVRLGTIPSADRVAAGINWARMNGARVGSLSLGTTPTAAAIAAVASAWAGGMVLCAATGNSGGNTTSPPINFPANHASVIAVGASDQADQRKRPASADGECWGSQFGPEIDVVAPGVFCWSTDEQGANGYNNNNGGPITWACVNYPNSGDATGDYVAVMNGTSAATPHVAGLAGLLLSEYPALTNQQVRDIIERTCDKVNPALYPYANDAGHPNGTWHQQMGHGRINCNAALRYADIMISDHDLDTGAVPSSSLAGGTWVPRIFWGYQPYVTTTDQPVALPPAHEPARSGQDNYVHAFIRNNGPANAQNIEVTWHIMDYPGTELIWPTDWNAANQIASASILSLAPGASIAIQALWPQASVNLASAYVHPCMVVKATCNQDVGGNLGSYVYQYNNIAQHNISFAGFMSTGPTAQRTFTLPFAVGHQLSRARHLILHLDLRKINGARVFLDVHPDSNLPYVDRIEEVMRKHPPKRPGQDHCMMTTVDDTRLLLQCCGFKAEVKLKAGSEIRLDGCHSSSVLGIDQLALKGAVQTTRNGRQLLLLEGAVASIGFPWYEGQILPMALIVEAPEDAPVGQHFRVDVTQVSDGVATGGVSLDIEARH